MSQIPDTVQRIRLIDLPNDVLQLIIQQLAIYDPLFIPNYEDDDFGGGGYGDYTKKREEFYGSRTNDDTENADGLLSWSRTCKRFRALLAPDIFKGVVVRSTPSSLDSIQQLSQTQYWVHVQQLLFAYAPSKDNEDDSDLDSDSEDDDGDETDSKPEKTNVKAALRNEANQLKQVLSNFPPNLNYLSLDFPLDWSAEFWYDRLMTGSGVREDPFTDRFSLWLRAVLESISQNDISSKTNFELSLFNVPPFHSLGYNKDWKKLLKHVTAFTLGLCHFDNGAGWELNTLPAAWEFAEHTGEYFWDHLERAKDIKLLCDSSWPFGPCEMDNPLPLPLPKSSDRFPKLERITFKNTFICDDLVAFFRAHAYKLTSIELIDCFAPGYSEDDVPSWADLFHALVEAHLKPKKLCNVTISSPARSLKELILGFKEEEQALQDTYKKIKAILDQQMIDEEQKIREGANKEDVERRRKQVLAYISVDDKYGMLFDSEEVNAAKFLGGQDYEAWNKLADLIEENIRRKGRKD